MLSCSCAQNSNACSGLGRARDGSPPGRRPQNHGRQCRRRDASRQVTKHRCHQGARRPHLCAPPCPVRGAPSPEVTREWHDARPSRRACRAHRETPRPSHADGLAKVRQHPRRVLWPSPGPLTGRAPGQAGRACSDSVAARSPEVPGRSRPFGDAGSCLCFSQVSPCLLSRVSPTAVPAPSAAGGLPRGGEVRLGLHGVAQAGVRQGLGEVGVGSHEAAVVQAGPQAGRAEALGSALALAGVGRQAIALGGQVCPKESLQQLEREEPSARLHTARAPRPQEAGGGGGGQRGDADMGFPLRTPFTP